MASLPRIPLFEAITSHDPSSTAVVHCLSGRSFTYGSLVQDVVASKERLQEGGGGALQGERVAFLIENGYDYVVTMLSIFACDAIAVPLAPSFPDGELRYILDHCKAKMLVTSPKFGKKADEVLKEGLQNRPIDLRAEKTSTGSQGQQKIDLEDVAARGGMILYTSGTTSRPKGVFLPQSALSAQVRSLHQAWHYSPQDRLLHILPLHHIHGTVNALLTPLFAGSSIEFLFPFNVDHVWGRLAAPFQTSNGDKKPPITFFTVVPTVYNRMLQSHASLDRETAQAVDEAIKPQNLRLNISGSAALPTPTKKAWSDISRNNILLERYGMTEVGMALSCGLAWEDRVDGSVGWPLPGVQARLVDSDTGKVIEEGDERDDTGRERQGEIQLKGATVFKEYWDNPQATASEFIDGWFKTGDIAIRKNVPGAGTGASGDWAKGPMYFIQGRKSADIIKTGGEKVSALEVEREMLSLPEISECAVVALPSEAWGQKVAAVVVLSEAGKSAGRGGKAYGAMDLRRALKDKLVAYKIPQDMKVVDVLPRNAMGKINKKSLVAEIFGDQQSIRRRSIEQAELKAQQRAKYRVQAPAESSTGRVSAYEE